MGAGLVTERDAKPPRQAKAPSWRLTAPDNVLTQGLVVSGFSSLPYAQALFLCFGWATTEEKGRWLQALQEVAPITDADGGERRTAAIAFSYTGLERHGLNREALASFSRPFQQGMYQEDRLRRLGDRFDGAWQGTVIKDGPRWSGNTVPRDADGNGPPVVTPTTVHALLLLYAREKTEVNDWAQAVEMTLASHNVAVVHKRALDLQFDHNIAREHFGFADGLSQPLPYGDSVIMSNGDKSERDNWHGVPLGEILFGHRNVHHEDAPGPIVKDDDIARAANLSQAGAPVGFLNFGRNGSYLVVRELHQYVAEFWGALEDAAAKIRKQERDATYITADWLAERIVGRDIDGNLLCPGGTLPPNKYDMPQNDFGFFDDDRYGLGCPLGSHVRRANPRDSLAKNENAKQTLLNAANSHRILRRARKFGPPPTRRDANDNQERGLLFMCLNTDIARQFEFVQQTWILNKNFATLFDETDPLVGPAGPFTVPQQPLRRIVDVRTFIQMAGGEYFFLPSIPALNYLALL